MELRPLNLPDLQKVREWRNQVLETLRTPYPLTEDDQLRFLRNYDSYKHRYWMVHGPGVGATLDGMGGITNIQWENRIGEISLIIRPATVREGLGTKAVHLLLSEAFGNMGLKTVFGECYWTNSGAIGFWKAMRSKYAGQETILPNRKLWKGKFYDSLYFSFDADCFVL